MMQTSATPIPPTILFARQNMSKRQRDLCISVPTNQDTAVTTVVALFQSIGLPYHIATSSARTAWPRKPSWRGGVQHASGVSMVHVGTEIPNSVSRCAVAAPKTSLHGCASADIPTVISGLAARAMWLNRRAARRQQLVSLQSGR